MATARDLKRIALSLDGTVAAPHFDRTAFKVRRIYTTLAVDGKTANLALTPDEQELKCLLAPEVYAPVPNAWGRQGWTTITLAAMSVAELRAALEMAWAHATTPRTRRYGAAPTFESISRSGRRPRRRPPHKRPP